MKSLFKKYYHSTLRPDEFSEVSELITDKRKESAISGLMKGFWDNEMNNADVPPRENPILFKRIKEAIWIERNKVAQRKIRIYGWAAGVAAVLVVALLVSNIIFYQHFDTSKLASQHQTISTPYGAKTNIDLPDGSSVWLNSGSTITYPVNFGNRRTISLTGEAFFDVKKSNSPFVVSTRDGDVVVKGTSFNVRAYPDEEIYETTLVEGVVDFKPKSGTEVLTLEPGDQLRKVSEGFRIEEVDTKYSTSWMEGKLIFNREAFPTLITKLERWYNVKINYKDSELDKLWYSGTIEMESISEVMNMISMSAPVTYSFDRKTRVFTLKYYTEGEN
ncbi:FecR family protein [Carboxylicivirga sp. M1479]|uniref:FecR family protein n=1 Tax=Carboxylicivirga sp. M1479 TaxID=2594476 RepID=UPI00117868AC|nr:FecR domain-containing protein [Carboxylicivirga sp. M1479]TRX66062.1 FecR family protein [Carboxylicivirga sp. M1479]